MLTENLKEVFMGLKKEYGHNALVRVEEMLASSQEYRKKSQQQAKYVLPGVSAEPWRNIQDYPDIKKISDRLGLLYPEIRKEIEFLSTNIDSLASYDHYQVSIPDWKAIYLYKDETVQTQNFNIVPATAKFMLEDLGDHLCPFGEMHFSILKPGIHVPPHSDLWNFTLNLHFAVVIPENCCIRVVDEIRQWESGKCLLFDYTHEHEAWNNSSFDRVCLLMDIWNPEITLAERKAIVALISEIRKLMRN